MTLTFEETKHLLTALLSWNLPEARGKLHDQLKIRGWTEAQFCQTIVEHGPTILNSEGWLKILGVLPNPVMRSQLDLRKFLSEEQIRKMPLG